jgi:HAD superfamily hydrolase (TIGR01509 family)
MKDLLGLAAPSGGGWAFDGRPVQAAVFDCDGVLVDSEPASERAWTRAVTAFGHVLEPGEFTAWVGRTDRELAEHYGGLLGVDPDALDLRAAAELRAALAGGLEPFSDAVAALDGAVAAGLPVAVASNSRRRRLDAILAAAGLASRFAVRVGSDDVATPKPAPDVYLEAATRLGVEPGRCLVLEDSPTGIAAARAAGMLVVAVDRGVFAPERLAGAHRVVADRARSHPVGAPTEQ